MPAPSVSGGSSVSSFQQSLKSNTKALRPGHEDELYDDDNKALTVGIFGVLYTVSKEKSHISIWFTGFRLFMDLLQLLLLVINPLYGFDIDGDSLIWRIVSFVQLNDFMSARGYRFFLGCMYVMVVALLANVALSAWVAWSFQNNRFDHVWPIKILRYFATIFYQVLDIASMTLFLMTLDCNYFGKPDGVRYYNQEFPDVYCWTMPHAGHVVVAVVSLIAFVAMAGLFTMAEMELNPLSKHYMAMAHSKVELTGFVVKVLMTCTSVFITSFKWMSVVQVTMSAVLLVIYLRWIPHLYAVVNHIRVASYAAVLLPAITFVIMAFHPGVDEDDYDAVYNLHKRTSIATWVLMPVAAALGWLASWLRHRYFYGRALNNFRFPPANAKPHKILAVSDARQVEILARCARKWDKEDNLDRESVQLAESVMKVGIAQLPKDPYMIILYSSFLIEVLTSYQSGYSQLQTAKKCDPSFLERFAIFSREQQHTQKAAGTPGQATDLVSYVEFQRNYSLALKLHREALLAIRAFWACLMAHNVPMNKMAKCLKSMDISIRAAERMYRAVLQRHANHVKMVRLYARFLQDVKQDPWNAATWFTEAEKLEQIEEEAKNNNVFGGVDGDPVLKQALANINDERAIIIMNAQSIIQVTNQAAHEMFGYSKNELRGKNVNILVPPPFNEHHGTYVRQYIATGQQTVMNQPNYEVVALHKEKYLVNIRMQVAKLSGIGEDTMLIALIQAIPKEPDTATVWVLSSGQVLSVDDTFQDWTGHRLQDLAGGPMTTLVAQHKQLGEVLKQARGVMAKVQQQEGSTVGGAVCVRGEGGIDLSKHSLTAQAMNMDHRRSVMDLLLDACVKDGDGDDSMVGAGPRRRPVASMAGLKVNHKYADPVEVDLDIVNAGIGAMQYHILTMRRSQDVVQQPRLMVTDTRGVVHHISTSLATLLGSTPKALALNGARHAINALMPEPFASLHNTLLQGVPPHVPPPHSCRSGLSVPLLVAPRPGEQLDSPVALPFRVAIKKRAVLDETFHVVAVESRSVKQAVDERCLRLITSSTGVVRRVLSDTPATALGFDPQTLVGRGLASFIDVFRMAEDEEADGRPGLQQHRWSCR